MLILYVLQALVPIALIGWIFFLPAGSLIGFAMQVLAVGVGLIALLLTGVLLFPPWWTPWAMGAALVAATLLVLRRRSPATIWPKRTMAWFLTAGFGVFAIFGVTQASLALRAAQLPAGPRLDLASPLGPGRYLVINGGTTTVLNAHADALDQSILAHRAYYGTAYGVDVVAIDRIGRRAPGIMPANPASYRIFGLPVVAPCPGVVVTAVDGLRDMNVPELDHVHLAGNHVILRCGEVHLLLAHFQHGSVRVRVGQHVAVGTMIAAVGNSGATSEPHLHIHAQTPSNSVMPFAGRPIPIMIAGRFRVRNSHFDVRGGL